MNRAALLLLVSLLFPAVPGQAQWKTLKSPAITVFFQEQREQQAYQVLAILEGYRAYVEGTLGLSGRRVPFVISDVGITSNGLTDPLFRRILLHPYSPSGGELSTLQSWWRLLGIHEYTHWVHLDAKAGLPKALTTVFGNILAPNLFAPAWLLEGLCVYTESGVSPYEGRLNDGTFDAYAAALARENALPALTSVTFQDSEFPGGTGPYLFGGLFFRWLADGYGEKALREFVRFTSSSVLTYLSPLVPAVGVDSSARKAFGEPLRALWKKWQKEERDRSAGFQAPEKVLGGGPGWLEEPVAREGVVYYRRSRPRDSRPREVRWAHELLRLDPVTGNERVLVRSTAPFTGPLVVRDGVLYYALLDLQGGFANTELSSFGYTAQVWKLDLQTGRRRRLLRAPLRTFTVLEDGDLVCSLDRPGSFGSELQLFRRQEKRMQPLFETDFLVAEIDSGYAGVFVSARRDGESFGVYRVRFVDEVGIPGRESGGGGPAGTPRSATGPSAAGPSAAGLSVGDLSLEPLLAGTSNQGQLCLAGERLYFSANPGGRYRIYARDLASGQTAVSDLLGYQSAPAFDPDTGRLYGLSLVAGGYALCELPDPFGKSAREAGGQEAADPSTAERSIADRDGQPRAATLRTEAPAPSLAPTAVSTPPPLPESEVRRGGYLDNLATLLPRVLLPVLSFDLATTGVQAGGALFGKSALGDLWYKLSMFYDSSSGNPEFEAALRVQPALPLQARLSFSSVAANVLSLTLLSPLYRSLNPGLWFVNAGAEARLFEDDFSRFEIAPLLGLGLHGPSTELAIRLSLPVERLELGSDRNALALTGSLELAQLLGPLEIGFEALGVGSFGGSLWLLPAPPGYTAGIPATLGTAARLELWVPLVRIRRGLWNPGIYLEDIYLAPFTAASFNEALDLQLSYGAELHVEIRVFAAATGVPADLFVRLSMTREGQPGISFGIEAVGLEDYLRGAHLEVTKS